MKQLQGYILVMGAAVCWGLAATLAKSLLNQQLDTVLLVQMRVTFSCLLLWLFFALFRPQHLRAKLRDLWRFALVGVVGLAGAHFTYYFTIKESTVATGILIQYTAPLLVLAYGAMAGEERFTAIKLGAAITSLLGCFLAVGAYDAGVLRLTPLGLMSGLGSVMTFAFMNVYSRHVLKDYSVWTLTFYAILFASLFWLVINPPWMLVAHDLSAGTWGALFTLAVLSVLIPHTLYFAGLQYLVPSRAIITSTLEPVVAIVSAAIVLAEYLETVQVLGALVVLSAIVLLQLKRESPQDPPRGVTRRERADAG